MLHGGGIKWWRAWEVSGKLPAALGPNIKLLLFSNTTKMSGVRIYSVSCIVFTMLVINSKTLGGNIFNVARCNGNVHRPIVTMIDVLHRVDLWRMFYLYRHNFTYGECKVVVDAVFDVTLKIL